MPLIYAQITLINADDKLFVKHELEAVSTIRQIKVNALAESKALYLTINEDIKNQLGLEFVRTEKVKLDSGDLIEAEIVGLVEVHFENTLTHCNAMVLPINDVLLGSMPFLAMNLDIDKTTNTVFEKPFIKFRFSPRRLLE
jgi:hypothetical protein